MSNSPRIQIFGRVIAEKVGKNPFTCRDVPEVPAASLKKLAEAGYLLVLQKGDRKGTHSRYYPTTYCLNPRNKNVRNLREATE